MLRGVRWAHKYQHTLLNIPHGRRSDVGIFNTTMVQGNVHPITGHEGPAGENKYTSTLSLTSAQDGGGL